MLDCVFERNTANGLFGSAGALNCLNSNPTIDNCTFRDNSAAVDGGIVISGGNPYMSNTSLCGNMPGQVNGPYTDNGGNCIQERCVDCEAPACPSDLNHDGQTDGADYGLFFSQWGACSECSADFDGNGVVDSADLGLFYAGWGPCNT